MAVGFPTKVSYANGDVFSASDINDTNGTINLLTSSTLSVAGGKNRVVNGGFDWWQRGTSLAISNAATTYLADRWAAYRPATGSTVSRQTTSDTTNLPTIQYCARVQRDSGNTSTSLISYYNMFESINSIPYAGQTVTFSFYARRGANYSAASNGLLVVLKTGTGTDQNVYSGFTGATNAVLQTATLTTTWQRFTYTATLASSITQIATGFEFTPVGTAGAADYFEVTGVQLELGSTATTFSRAGGTIQGELAACQRYYYRVSPTNASIFAYGSAANTTIVDFVMPLPVTLRTASSTIEYASVNVQDGANTYATATYTIPVTSQYNVFVRATFGIATVTQFRPYSLQTTSGSGYMAISAEL